MKQHYQGEMPQNEGASMRQMIDASVEQSRLDFRTRQEGLIDDLELLRKTAHVRLKNESIFQLIARTGISPAEMGRWPKETITHFCTLATERSRDEEHEPKSSYIA